MNSIKCVGKSCVGCGNCKAECPFEAIEMQYDKEGFLIPIVDKQKCCNCGKCKTVCPAFIDENSFNACQKSYIAISKSKSLYRNAASGGVFSAFATFYFETFEKVVVVGAAYVDEMVQHIMIDKPDELWKLQGSKYVQSNLNDIVSKVIEKLKNSYYVVFSGTPCQIMAVKKIIPNTLNERLFLIDLVCHGVPSPIFLKKDLDWISHKNKIDYISFRSKSRFCKSKSEYFLTVGYRNKNKKCSYKSDPYYSLFMKGSTFRESCYKCSFAKIDRVGDVTVGDCDSSHLYKTFYPDFATSLLMINTKNGANILNQMEKYIEKKEIDITKEILYNVQLAHPSDRPVERDYIYRQIINSDMKDIATKYARKKSLIENIGIFLFDFIPRSFIQYICSFIKGKG